MNPTEFTPEQQKDIESRVEKAKKALDDLKLQPSCTLYMVNTGDDVFGIKAVPFLQDTKYLSKLSPIQPEKL